MEFPDLGAHCSMKFCNKLDFLPVKCDCCLHIFCTEHMRYNDHRCPKSGSKDIQVPICPLCNNAVPSKRHEPPDIAVSAHIDRDCESDPAIGRRKVYINKCSLTGCRRKEVVPFICTDCKLNFCVSHRHPRDHECLKKSHTGKSISNGLPIESSRTLPDYGALQGNLGEDEALARALVLSYEENEQNNLPGTSKKSADLSYLPSIPNKKKDVSSNCHLS